MNKKIVQSTLNISLLLMIFAQPMPGIDQAQQPQTPMPDAAPVAPAPSILPAQSAPLPIIPEQAPAPMQQPTPPPAPMPAPADQAPASDAMPTVPVEASAPAPALTPEPSPAPAPESAPTQAPAPSLAAQAPAATVPAPATEAPNAPRPVSSQDVEQLNGYLNTINTAKDELKQLLSRIDDEVGKAKTAASQVRKRSMEILSQKDDAAATAIVDEIIASSATLKKTYDDLSTSVNSTFQSGISNIQTTINTMQETLKSLKAQGIAFQASLPAESQQSHAQKTAQNASHMIERNWFIADTSKEQKSEDKTIIHFIFNKVADLISEIARFIYATYNGIKAAWFSGTPTKQPEGHKEHPTVPATLPPALPTAPAMPTT